ncbi:MAG: class I SAM-dependent methyltransferase [Anaerolineales bacterium]
MNSNPDYEYRGLLAETWDLFRGDTSQWEDRAFYLELISEYGQPVLDVGCGTGRLLLDYLQAGIDIDGVDVSPEMIALCRAKAAGLGLSPTIHQGTMEGLALPRKYRMILVPSSSFQLLTDPADARTAIHKLYEHLQPGGALVMPFMILWKPGDPVETDWAPTGEKVRAEDGAVVRRWSRARYEPEARLEHTEDRYEVQREGSTVAREDHMRSPATRWYTQEEGLLLYREAGFREVKAYREFHLEPAQPEDMIFTLLGVHPA